MTTDLEMDIAPDHEKKTLDIGQVLRAKRLALSLDERYVATELKLSIEHVYALERNEFSRFRSATFARGYLKSYCRLLEIDHRPMMAAFDEQQSVKESNIRPVDNVKTQASGRDPIFVIISAIIIAIITFVIFWWPSYSSEPDPQQDPTVQEEHIESEPSSVDVSAAEETVLESAAVLPDEPPKTDVDAALAELDRVDLSNLARVDVAESQEGEANVVTGLSAETIALLEDAGVDAEQVVEATREPEFAPTPVNDEPTPTAVASASDIVVRFSADCWTEVRDRTGRILYSGVKSAGSSLELDGQAPYRVTLGYARGVTEFLYKGEPFDFSTHIRKDLARFELE